MDRSKIIAVLTGAIAIILSLAYLVLVQLLDFRGEMLPAPDLSAQPVSVQIAQTPKNPSHAKLRKTLKEIL
jgi:uncharacterized protein YneF (UPF0154 family)